ncbi:MAG: ribosome biogenesis GTPase YlqF [Clostridia bacterium]|nr:ribosome biogenesis GTPase YlqF [Clostridia bacterium]
MQNNIQWYPGHMTKTRRLIEKNLKLIDVVVEILDARVPMSGRNPNFDDIIKGKPRLLVMNKSDLADTERTKEWIKWFTDNGISVIPISCATGKGLNNVINSARALVQDKIDREKEKGRNITVKIMMVGIPNVGKSSLINKLVGKASAKTGDRPGVTRGEQWIRIRSDVELLDTPGILPPKFDNQELAKRLAYTGAIKDEIMNIELLAYSLLDYLRDNYHDILCTRYKLSDIEDLEGYQILEMIGKKRGCVVSGGEIDMERAANLVIDELRSAKIGNITLELPSDFEVNT